jgi:NADH:ubiquinone oxidoreductase subunit 6 (subunit J)
MLDSAIFWVFAVLSIAAALGAVLNRSIIYAALCLIAVFMSIAGFYVLNNADFLAIAQIIIYAVGLTIIMLFAIMFTGDKPMESHKVNRTARIAYGIIIAYVFALLLRGMLMGSSVTVPSVNADVATRFASEGSTVMLGELLFNKYALPFELASILLLVAMIGAIVVAKKRFVESESELLGDVRLPVDLSSAPPEDAIAALRSKRLGGQSQDERLSPQTEMAGHPETSPATAPDKAGASAD